MSDYCPGVPDRRWWRLFRGAPLGLKLSSIILALPVCWAVLNLRLVVSPVMMSEFREVLIRGIALYVVVLLVLFHMLNAVVRGCIPYVCTLAKSAGRP